MVEVLKKRGTERGGAGEEEGERERGVRKREKGLVRGEIKIVEKSLK